MKNLRMIFPVVATFVLLFSSCLQDDNSSEPPCRSNELGEIHLSKEAEDFLPIKEGEKIIFINQYNSELRFDHEIKRGEGKPVNVNFLCSDDYYFDRTISRYDYYKTHNKLHILTSEYDGHELTARVFVGEDTSSIDTNNERIEVGFNRRAIAIYDIQEESFEETFGMNVAEKLDTIELNGKTFSNVLRIQNDNFERTIYVKKEVGIIGFEVDVKVYVLKKLM